VTRPDLTAGALGPSIVSLNMNESWSPPPPLDIGWLKEVVKLPKSVVWANMW
jgi:hypothetical protein